MEEVTSTVPPRRLAAIAFVDLVGFSSLAHSDEDKSLRMLERFRVCVREEIKTYGGREIKSLGDGFLLEFASARDGVHASLAIQQRLAELPESESSPRPRARIGLHVGDVALDGEDLLGDGVNLAARIEPLAPTGGVCVTEQVVKLLGSDPTLGFALLGKRSLRSFPGTVRVYRAYRSEESVRGHRLDPVRFALRGRALRIALLAAAVLAAASLLSLEDLVDAVRRLPQAPSTHPRNYPWQCVAALPLEPIGDRSVDINLLDRLNEDLATKLQELGRIHGFIVRDSQGFKLGDRRWSEAGRDLRAGAIIHGTVQLRGDRFYATVELTDALTDETWSKTSEEAALAVRVSVLVEWISDHTFGVLIRRKRKPPDIPGLEPSRSWEG